MMMPRKKRRTILIVSIVLIILIIAITLVLLYLTTDMFKSNATLFAKYMGQNVENIQILSMQTESSNYEVLKENPYTSETQIKVNYAENIGTSSESTQNSINHLKVDIKGQTDKKQQYDYQDIKLLNDEEKVAEVEYIQNGNTYGIRFSDIFSQYVLANNENIKTLLQKLGYTEEQISNIPDKLEWNNEFANIFQLTEEEKQLIEAKYINIINANVSKDNFSKQSNQLIEIDGKKINTNAYILAITKEQLNDIYIKILEEMKQDQIILSRLEKIQNTFSTLSLEKNNLKEQFQKYVEETITDISKNNIGKEQTKIIVYESNYTTIKTMIQTNTYEIVMDTLFYQGQDYAKIAYRNITEGKEEEKSLTYKNTENELSIVLKNIKNGETTQYSLLNNDKVEENNGNRSSTIKFEDKTNRVEATITEKITTTQLQNQEKLDDKNSINLSELEAEQAKAIFDRVKEGVTAKIDEITNNTIKKEDIWEVIKATKLVEEKQVLESTGITETEKNRFNSKFEILQGEKLEEKSIAKVVDAVEENLIGIEVVSNTEIRLKLDRFNKNEEEVSKIRTFVEKDKNRKYNVKVEYDEKIGLINGILLTILER